MNPPRLRVLQCITRLGLGGAERVACTLVEELPEQFEVAVFTVYGADADGAAQAQRASLRRRGARWFAGTRLPLKAGGMVTGGLALARAIRAFRPDVIHLHAEPAESAAAVASYLVSVPAVRTIHNSVFWRYWPRLGRWTDRRLAAARVAAVSEAARAEFLRYRADSGAPAAQPGPVVIVNGVAAPALPPRNGPLQADRRRVLFAGRFEPQKALDVLAAALPGVRLPPGVSGELVLIGHGALAPVAQTLARRPPAGWSVEVRPPAPGLGAVFPGFDLVVMPSRFEGLPLVAVEAALAGLPVVAADAPGLREALPDDQPWRYPPGDPAALADALSDALAQTGRWEAVAGAAQARAQAQFHPARFAGAYAQLYRDTVAALPGARPRP